MYIIHEYKINIFTSYYFDRQICSVIILKINKQKEMKYIVERASSPWQI